MLSNKTYVFQCLGKRLLTVALLAGSLAGCADALDQTSGDITAPAAGMMHLAQQMRAQGDDQGAMEFYARAVQRAPDDADAHLQFATLLEAHNDNQDAADQYRALVDLKPDAVDYRRDYGRVLLKLGRLDDAKQQYSAALKIDPADLKSLNGLGITLDLGGDHPAAQQQYQAALQQAPDDLVTINNLGHSFVLAGDYDNAIRTLEPRHQNPAAPPALRENLAAAYAMIGMDVDAERVLKIDLPPDQEKLVMAHYHALRHQAAAPMVFANLGSFSTADLAQARLDKVHHDFASETAEYALEVMPKVDTEGGTPDFYAEATGFKNLAAAEAFCRKLSKAGAFCKAREG